MDAVQDEVYILAVPNKYGSYSRLIKDLIIHFESAEQDGISNNHKKMVENSNRYHIL